MFKNEYEYLIHLIHCTIHDQCPQLPTTDISLDKVFFVAKEHEVANISFVSIEKIRDVLSDELYKQWKTQYAFSIQRNINQETARNTIVTNLIGNNIRSIELQGTVIKNFYPHAFWRNMSDIDFIVDKQNLSNAERVLQNLGYVTKKYGDYDVSAYSHPQIAVELHSDFFDPNTEFYGKMTDPFKNATYFENDNSYKASNEDIFIYNILHCIKHWRGSGMGIRRIIDIYYLNKILLPKLDLEFVYQTFESLNCKKDYEILSQIALQWFGDKNIKCDFSYEKNKIFMSNTHGNPRVSMLNDYVRDNNKKFFKIKRLFKKIFPPKSNIYSSYSFCSKNNLPLIICWIYRWFYLIFSKRKRKHIRLVIKNLISFRGKRT